MKISKTQFINFIKSDRFVGLNQIYHEQEKVIVSKEEDLELNDLMSLENKQFINEILDSMYDYKTDEDLIEEVDAQLEMMLPYYNELEILSGRAIKDKFGGEVIYSLETYKQKRFNYLKDGYDFYCFLDGFQEDDNTIRIFETKATTSSKFSIDKFNFKTKVSGQRAGLSHPFFIENSEGFYIPHEDIGLPKDSTYYKKEQILFDKYSDQGRYIYDLAYQKYITDHSLKSNKNVEYYLVILNHEYIHDGRVDENNKPIYPNNIVRFYNMTTLLNKMMPILEEDLNDIIERLNKMDTNEVGLGRCYEINKGSQPIFNDICYSDLEEENSILVYTDRHHGFTDEEGIKHELSDLINMGYKKALDIPEKWLTRPNNVIQRRVIESGKPYFNVDKIRAGIKLLKYPIYHLDFESFNCPLPRFSGETPYTQSLFQYSIHIEKEPGVSNKDSDHYGFLAKDHKDRRLELLESMLNVIKEDGGTILVYNISFERSRLKELQKYYPKHFNRLEDIINRLFDLMDIVKTNTKLYQRIGFDEAEAKEYNFYHNDLQGSFSIKKVLPIFTNLSYSDLEVQNGTEAMVTYHKLPSLDKEEFSKQYQALVEYCKQDTWAMFEILNNLRKL